MICIKQAHARSGFDELMTRFLFFIAALSLAGLALADSDTDAVNERIPVSPDALERHWRVDCADAWARWQKSTADNLADTRANNPAEVATDLGRELKLCAFIYQAPGDDRDHRHPDYRSAADTLARSREPSN